MEKKEYISPETKLILLDASVLQTQEGVYQGSDDDITHAKGNSTWEEPEYDDDGFGW